MLKDLFQRFSSRKWLISLVGSISGLIVLFGGKAVSDTDAESIATIASGLAMVLGSILGYVYVEGKVDAAKVANKGLIVYDGNGSKREIQIVPPRIPTHEEVEEMQKRNQIAMKAFLEAKGFSPLIASTLIMEPVDKYSLFSEVVRGGVSFEEAAARFKEFGY